MRGCGTAAGGTPAVTTSAGRGDGDRREPCAGDGARGGLVRWLGRDARGLGCSADHPTFIRRRCTYRNVTQTHAQTHTVTLVPSRDTIQYPYPPTSATYTRLLQLLHGLLHDRLPCRSCLSHTRRHLGLRPTALATTTTPPVVSVAPRAARDAA